MKTCKDVWQEMTDQSAAKDIRNYNQTIDMRAYTVITDMFPLDALKAYSAYNLGDAIQDADKKYFNADRGGKQGDYREGMPAKIDNVIDCLRHFPNSKRALITICNNPAASHRSDDDAKCMREIHFYVEDGALCASVFFRAQAAQIFPKNIHFIGSLMDRIRTPLDLGMGHLHYHSSILVSDRS